MLSSKNCLPITGYELEQKYGAHRTLKDFKELWQTTNEGGSQVTIRELTRLNQKLADLGFGNERISGYIVAISLKNDAISIT